jgi:hypothetical protein
MRMLWLSAFVNDRPLFGNVGKCFWVARTRIKIPNTRPSSGITNHDPDTASTDRPIPAAARWRIVVHVLSTRRLFVERSA